MKKHTYSILLLLVAIGMVWPVQAGVSMEEARRLANDLTPFGGERASNEEGTIPSWNGGMTVMPETVIYDPNSGDHLPNPFVGEKTLYIITAENMEEHKKKLSQGQQALLKRYPDTYRLHVYPTHRTSAAPQWVYDNTARNAVKATLTDNRQGVTGAYGGIPFPIVKQGEEAIFNYQAHWNGGDTIVNYKAALVHADGSRTSSGGGEYTRDRPYYDKTGSEATWNGWLEGIMVQYQVPVRRKGEILLILDPLAYTSKKRAAWQYIPGQRRVRRAPSIEYDTPNPTFGGLATYDDAFMFNGAIDRYNWKLVGKKEVIVPYHNYDFELAKLNQVLTPHHINPDYVRWELHRVWVIEASLKKGQRHAYSRRIMYLDEDSWMIILQDKFDGRGNLWRTTVGLTIMDWNIPVLLQSTQFYYDLQSRDYAVGQLYNEIQGARKYTNIRENQLTPQNVRKLGKR